MSEPRVLGSDAARAVGRFQPDGPTGYRAATMPDAPLRATHAEAVADEAAWLDREQRRRNRWATIGLMAAAGRMPHKLADPVGHWDAQTSTADWRTALCIARGIPLDQIDPARGVGPIRPTRVTGQQLTLEDVS